MHLNNYYKDLPEGFVEDYNIDAKNTKTVIIMNIVAVVMLILSAVVCYLLKFESFPSNEEIVTAEFLIALIIFIFALILYLILHELTHGVVYKIFTKQKLKFGLTLTVAYCGLKEGYVNKKTALCALLAPFTIHCIWMIIAICLMPANAYALLMILLFSIHFSGCVGDLYDTFVLTIKYAGKQVLINDNGPKQTFYTYKPDQVSKSDNTINK